MKYETKEVLAEDLKVGDTMMCCNKPRVIKAFREYKGNFDFVLKVAEYTDGTAMSLTKGYLYRVVI
jgi:hypothetical protein